MALTEILTFTLVAALLVMSPGPNGVLVAKTVPADGRAAGFANVAGFVAAFYLHGALSILGISIILVQSATAFTIVKYLGAAYLCWIGIRSLYAAMRGGEESLRTNETEVVRTRRARDKRTMLRAFSEGLLTNALNPKVSMFYLAAFPQFIPSDEASALSAFVLVFVHSLLNAIWFGAMVLLLASATTAFRSEKLQRGIKAVTGVVFIGFGVQLTALRAHL